MYIRGAVADDFPAIRSIYNQGIADRIATLDEDQKTTAEIAAWFDTHAEPYCVLVALCEHRIAGWTSLNAYSHRCAYRGVGTALLRAIDEAAVRNGFHKIVLFALAANGAGRALYGRAGYADVGTFRNQGRLDGRFVDVIAMEKLLPSPA